MSEADQLPRESYITIARYRKAEKLASAARAAGMTRADIRRLDDEGRRDLEAVAGVLIASDITWGTALLLLDDWYPRPSRSTVTLADVRAAVVEAAARHGLSGRT